MFEILNAAGLATSPVFESFWFGALVGPSPLRDRVDDATERPSRGGVGQCNKEVAASLRKDFGEAYGELGTWHAFVGRDMGCYVTHKEGCYIYLYVGHLGICLFAT